MNDGTKEMLAKDDYGLVTRESYLSIKRHLCSRCGLGKRNVYRMRFNFVRELKDHLPRFQLK